MRLDRVSPRTWLLATVAAWAVACWALALAGLGAHAGTLPADAALLQPLPQVPATSAPRLKPLAQYDAAVARPLLANDRRPHPFLIEGHDGGDGEPTGASFDYLLTSVLIAPPLRMAIIQPQGGGDGIRVRMGASADAIPGWRLVELGPRGAVFEGPGGRRALELRTFDGTGGQPPSQGQAAGERQRARSAAEADQAARAANADAAIEPPVPPPTIAPQPASTQVQQQADAIRKRIEARRAQMRREATQSTANDRNP